MADTEEYFPRGGKKPTVLFKQTANFLGAPEKSDKKKKRPKKKSEGDDGYLSDDGTREVDQSYKNCAVGLSYQTIKPGVIVLGRVRYVQETKIIVMLPCRLIGNVMACHISEPYNKILEAYVNDQVDKVRELREMFKPGQYIAVKVLEVQGKSLMLSLMPQHVNSEKMVADIVKGTIIQAAVSSIEDHGYVMDIGIPNTKVFLPKKAANPDIELDVGMITWCAVKSTNQSPESSIITVSNSLGAVQGSLLKSKPNLLLPGSNVEFTVDTPLDNGLEGTIFGDVTCYIQRQHVDKVKGKKPALGQKIRARVLYVMPTRLTPFLTMRNVFETTYPDLEEEQLLKDGDIVEDAIVLKISGRSVQFKLGAGSAGVMSLKRLQVDEDLSDEQVIAKSYPIGSSHKVRVLCYNMSDYLYSVTDQPEVVNERYFSIHQLAVGDLVTAAVSAVTDTQLHVTVGRVKGFVPQTHMSEVGVYVDNKKARVSNLSHKKYKVGQSVSGRVLSVDREKPSLVVTLKPSLLAPDLVILKEYTDAQVGHAYTGVVRLIRDYLLVSFFNNVTAFVPRNFVTRDETQNLSDAFHLGQIVTCTILNVRPEDKKMTGSLTTAPFTPDENKKSKLKRKNGDQTKEQDTVKKKKYDEEDSEVKSKKKNKKTEDSDQSVESHDTKKSSKKKQKIEVSAEESDSAEEELQQEPADVKKKKNKHKVEVKSEESDAIETDVNDEEDILTPHEQGLLDMSDCLSLKDFKKRSVALLKAIKVRVKRLQVVNEKISTIEEKGLTSRNKKYHTAMHTEKLLIQQRVEKLQNAHNSAQEKLKELGYEKNESYKEEQKKRKRERTVENKSQKEDKKNVKEDKKSVKEDKKSVKEEGVKKERSKESLKEKIKDIKVAGGQPALEVPSAKEFWAENDEEQKNVKQEESSSSEEEEQEQPKKKRKKLSVAEKLSKLREEEERVRALEAEASGAGGVPRALDQFERAVLSQPSNSQLWIAYMAFHLQATELEKARGVARRALAAIPFRAEHDKGNVWLALLNLEHRFGNRETQQKVLEEALQMNDPYKVHEKLLDILLETGKHQELSSLSDLMIRKYKRSSECYMSVGKALYRANLIDKARQVMQKAIAVLEKKEHVSILVHFALLERSHGGRERCEALFEQVLTAYPQRVDVACVYLDMLGKSTDVDHVRQVLERLTSQKLSARKMKVLYNKWVDIEEKIGDESHAEEIRQRAVQFIEKAKF